MHSSVHCSIIYLQQPKYEDNLSVHQQVNGEETLCEYSIHTMEYYLAKEQNEILPSTTERDLKGNMLTEVSHTEKDKDHMISLIWDHKRNKQKSPSFYRHRE